MGINLADYLVIGISSRALFDLSRENEIFESEGLEGYSAYQIEHEDDPLQPGTGFPLVKAILHLNRLVPGKRRSEVVVMSRNNADTSLRIFRSIEHHGLDISRAALTSGAPLSRYLTAYDVDLFLSAEPDDVQGAIDAGVAAARLYPSPPDCSLPEDQIRIAFDGDAVLFSEESERIFKDEGLEAFLAHERANARRPLPEGPFAKLLKTLSFIQHELRTDPEPIRTALVTSRNSPAHERVIRTLRTWSVRVDEAFFLGGASKDGVLRAFAPHIFFDDQVQHLDPSADHVPVGQVPYPTGSPLQLSLEGLPAPTETPKAKSKRKPKKSPVTSPEVLPVPPKAKRKRPRRRGSTTEDQGPD